jgi:mannose-6-phosphate isomerase-like protein (cupin superfamily)
MTEVTEMSYPEPRYHGEPGLVNATFRPSGQAPEVNYPNGGTAAYLATGESTSGQFGLFRWEMSGVPSGPTAHFHRTISESFYVLSGTIRLYDGKRWIDGTPGDFLFVPEGGLHAFRNESGEPASMLILFAPGAPREEYFETTAKLAGGLVLSDEERAAFYVRNDTYWR